jgi:hypothetical protein
MEKLPHAANPETADWRYGMILPDGSLFGDSHESVVFCHTCHVRVARNDHLFFVPRELRLAPCGLTRVADYRGTSLHAANPERDHDAGGAQDEIKPARFAPAAKP